MSARSARSIPCAEFLPSLKLKGTLIRESAGDYDAMKKFAAERALPMDFCTMPLPATRGACSQALECRMGVSELIPFCREKKILPENEGCEVVDPSLRKGVFCRRGHYHVHRPVERRHGRLQHGRRPGAAHRPSA